MHVSYIQSEDNKKEALNEIIRLKGMLKEYESSKSTSVLKLKVSITSIMWRVHDKKSGFNLRDIRKHYSFSIEEFCKNYELAKEAFSEGDMAFINDFFDTYV